MHAKVKAAKKAALAKVAASKKSRGRVGALRVAKAKPAYDGGLGPLGSALMGMMGSAPGRPSFALPPPPPMGKHPFPPLPPGVLDPAVAPRAKPGQSRGRRDGKAPGRGRGMVDFAVRPPSMTRMPEVVPYAGPPPPRSKALGLKMGLDPLEEHYERWLDIVNQPELLELTLPVGSVLETATVNSAGVIDGTCLWVLRYKGFPDQAGCFLEVAFGGASAPHHGVALDGAFGYHHKLGASPMVLHWCVRGAAECEAECPGRQVLHMQHLRVRRMNTIKDSWAKDLESVVKIVKDEQGEGDEESVASSAEGRQEKLTARAAQLRRRLLENRMNDPSLRAADRLSMAVAQQDMLQRKGILAGYEDEDEELDAQGRKSKKKSKSGKKKKKKKRSSSSSGSTSGAETPLFREATPLGSGSASAIKKAAEDQPGELYTRAVMAVERLLGGRGVATDGKTNARWGTYLRAIVFAQYPASTLPPEKVELMQLLAKTLDTLGEGCIKKVADLLSQEFKSQEMMLHGREDLAKEMRLTGLEDRTLTSQGELAAALRHKRQRQLLEDGRR